MRKLALILSLAAACGLGTQTALGMGGEHPKGRPVGGSDEWPAGLRELVNGTEWFRGWWVNANDWFFYQGDTAALNSFLQKYSQLEGTPLAVVLHAGKGTNRGMAGEDEAQPMDWELRILRRGWGAEGPAEPELGQSRCVVSVHVWLGGGIELGKLQVPPYVAVKSEGQIEGFAGFMANRRKAQPRPELTAASLDRLWEDLASKGYTHRARASATLVWGGEEAGKFLSRRLAPAVPDPAKIKQWIAELDSNQYQVRQKAHAELAALDLAGLPALQEARKGKLSAEAERRIDELLARQPLLLLRLERAVAVLEEIGSPPCVEALRRLASAEAGAPQRDLAKAALERLSKARSQPASQPAAGA